MTSTQPSDTSASTPGAHYVTSRMDVLEVSTTHIPPGQIGDAGTDHPVRFLIDRLTWDYIRTKDGPWKPRWVIASGPRLLDNGQLGTRASRVFPASSPYLAWAVETMAAYEATTDLQVVRNS